MKSTPFSILTVSVIFSLFSLNIFAQDYTQWSLPEGVRARLGKGQMSGDIAYSPDGTRLAVASSIGIWLYDTETHQEVALLTGHTDWVISVSFSPDGSTLASGSSDGTILLWEVIPAPSEPEKIAGDINRDGVVNISDLLFVAKALGRTEPNDADVNGDGAINILDLVLVASNFGNTAAAPLARAQIVSTLTAADVERWLTQAEQVALTDPAYLRGIAVLEQLLSMLTPKETILLLNYPNPFNPETWIPYHLANASDVQISIYDTNGALVRQLDLGHQQAGYYTNRSRAVYWDGRNEFGEQVASGVYFYHLSAGVYSATRQLVILK